MNESYTSSQIKSRAGTKMDGYFWSYNIPEHVWEVTLNHGLGLEFAFWPPGNEFEGLAVIYSKSGDTGEYKGKVANQSEADRIVQHVVHAVGNDITDEDALGDKLKSLGWKLI
jgi:hypothetical protein